MFDLRPLSQGDRAAVLMVREKDRREVLVLREVGRNASHAGRGNVGPRLLSFEAGSPAELDLIEQRFGGPAGRRRACTTGTYRAIFGLDPDRIEVAIASSLTSVPIRTEDWSTIDDLIYAIE